jgi:ABC-type antimicrobial peptide transport system permease subunit
MALGATVRHVVTLVMRDTLRPVVAGLAVGAIAALFAGRVLGSLLYGVGPRDPIALVSAVALLFSAATAATFIPARRVARVDPLQDLKTP